MGVEAGLCKNVVNNEYGSNRTRTYPRNLISCTVSNLSRNLNRRDCPPDRSLVSVETAADDISATGSPRRLSPGTRRAIG